jgi:hypothetical protein
MNGIPVSCQVAEYISGIVEAGGIVPVGTQAAVFGRVGMCETQGSNNASYGIHRAWIIVGYLDQNPYQLPRIGKENVPGINIHIQTITYPAVVWLFRTNSPAMGKTNQQGYSDYPDDKWIYLDFHLS